LNHEVKRKHKNYAFIDGNNLHLGIQYQAWQLDYKKFRLYLKDKFDVVKAYYFIGYIPRKKTLYKELIKYGFILKFKHIIINRYGDTKGNVDSNLILYTLTKITNYDKAVIVASDGDYYCLVKYLDRGGKLLRLIIPDRYYFSKLYKKKKYRKYLFFMNDMRFKLSF